LSNGALLLAKVAQQAKICALIIAHRIRQIAEDARRLKLTSRVGVTLIGQSLSLPTETVSRNAVAVTAGVTLDLSSTVALKIRGDAAAGGGINYVGGGWAGLSVKF
jgi:hypothetical protein